MGSNPETKTQADFQKIYDLLKQAETTNKTAKFLVGYSYYQGFLVKQDYKKAFLLIKAVADAAKRPFSSSEALDVKLKYTS